MTALDNAIRWKVDFITDMLGYLRTLPPPLAPHAQEVKDTLEKELPVVQGNDKAAAYDVVVANLQRWTRAARGAKEKAHDVDEIVAWIRIVRERQTLLDELEKEGRP